MVRVCALMMLGIAARSQVFALQWRSEVGICAGQQLHLLGLPLVRLARLCAREVDRETSM
jgi:hypothetical protein